jgi:hypothetical protein
MGMNEFLQEFVCFLFCIGGVFCLFSFGFLILALALQEFKGR